MKWVYLLYNSKKYVAKDSKIPSEIESETGMAEVVEVVKKTNSDEEMRARMEDRENSQIYLSLIRGSGYKKGIIEGEIKGIEKEKKVIIKKLLSKGKTKEEILDLIDITSEEYEKLIN